MSMKTLLIAAVAIGGVIYSDLNAQRGGGARGGGATARPGGNPGGNSGGRGNFGGTPAARLGNGLNRGGLSRGLSNRFGRQGLGSLNYGWGYGTNGWGYPAYYSDSAWPATYGGWKRGASKRGVSDADASTAGTTATAATSGAGPSGDA